MYFEKNCHRIVLKLEIQCPAFTSDSDNSKFAHWYLEFTLKFISLVTNTHVKVHEDHSFSKKQSRNCFWRSAFLSKVIWKIPFSLLSNYRLCDQAPTSSSHYFRDSFVWNSVGVQSNDTEKRAFFSLPESITRRIFQVFLLRARDRLRELIDWPMYIAHECNDKRVAFTVLFFRTASISISLIFSLLSSLPVSCLTDTLSAQVRRWG